jgi:hypothetical protein
VVSATAPAAAPKTPWGEPDLQGIWTEETDTPLQRPAKYADQEFFAAAQRVELDVQREGLAGKRAERGTEADVGGSYNQLFVPRKHTGMRTSMIVDLPDGRIPQLTAEAQKIAAAEREYRLALLQSTDTCKNRLPACAGGNTIQPPRRDALSLLLATSGLWSAAGTSIATMVRRIACWGFAAWPAGCLSLQASASGGLCRHQVASRCSTTWAKGKGGNAIS